MSAIAFLPTRALGGPLFNQNSHVDHTALQARLQHIRVPLEHPHDTRPAQTRKHGPGALSDALSCLLGQSQGIAQEARAASTSILCADERVVTRRLESQLCHAQDQSRKDVDDNLLAHTALVAAKHIITT